MNDIEEKVARVHTAAKFIEEELKGRKPEIGIILGSGLGQLGESIEDPIVIPYKTVPCFPVSTVIGHKGNFICGTLGGKTVLAMQGRFHYYEGYTMEMVTISIRVMKLLGIHSVFVSNAAGSCNPELKVGDLVVIKDHINFLPNSLIGQNFEEFGPRFPDMTCAYDLDYQELAFSIGKEMGLDLQGGVYSASTGPTYETPAEVRFYRMIGADLLGMSTVPEVIVARQCGLRVFGMSVVTNECNISNRPRRLNDPEDVVKQADKASKNMCILFRKMIEKI